MIALMDIITGHQVANDPLGANFEANVLIDVVQPVIIWPTASILNYGQTLATATLNYGATYNPIDPNPTFAWTLANPNYRISKCRNDIL